jgi:hypothetical protein
MIGKGNTMLALCAATALGCESVDAAKVSGPATPQTANSVASEFVTTGGAEITFDVFGPEFVHRHSFVANKDQTGTVVGQYSGLVTMFGETAVVHADVTCFTITHDPSGSGGQQARLEGVITHTTNEQVIGEGPIAWTVVDNGEGANSPPDLASPLFAGTGELRLHCVTGFALPVFEVTSGNVKIHK